MEPDESAPMGISHIISRRSKYEPVEEVSHEQNLLAPRKRGRGDAIDAIMVPESGSLTHLFFGFLYDEDPYEDEEFETDSTVVESPPSPCNTLNFSLFVALSLLSAATSAPIALTTSLVTHFGNQGEAHEKDQYDREPGWISFAPHVTSAAVFGAAIGKFVNGPVVELVGARRSLLIYSVAQAFCLGALACATSVSQAVWACGAVEFCSSVTWPGVLILLVTHYHDAPTYSQGVSITSLATRSGSLVSMAVISSISVHWRSVALFAAWVALIASSIIFHFVPEASGISSRLSRTRERSIWGDSRSSLTQRSLSLFRYQVIPPMARVLASPTFWLIAIAHTGSSLVRTAERCVGSFISEMSVSKDYARFATSALSGGTWLGILLGGAAFCRTNTVKDQLWLVSRLYALSVAACYLLAGSAMQSCPPVGLAALAMVGFGTAVPFYHIPSLVSASQFGVGQKGIFVAYLDGVGYAVASWVWSVLAKEPNWAYRWATVALVLIVSAVLMTEYLDHWGRSRKLRSKTDSVLETTVFF